MKQIFAMAAFSLVLGAASPLTVGAQQTSSTFTNPPGFKGEIKLDVRDSKADWDPYIPKKAAPGSPNIRIAKNIVTLPPGTTRTRFGDTSIR